MKNMIFAIVMTIVLTNTVHAKQETFQWEISPNSDCAGYRLYMKDVDTGALTKLGPDIPGRDTKTATVDVVEPVGIGQFWVVAKSYDLAGNESEKESNKAYTFGTTDEIIWQDITPPEPPTMLQVLRQIAGALERIAKSLEK